MGSPPNSYANAIDKLIIVSKIFADQRVGELITENRKLKLQLFWKDYGTTHLQEAMRFANQKIRGPDCNCLACAVSGRKDEDNGMEAEGFECLFKPYFEELLVECEIVSTNGGWDSEKGFQHISNATGNYVFDEDCHIVRIARDDWFLFTYGARLWKANNVESPELLKLRNLFEKLQEE
jgi:hypothetical protein